MKQHPNPTYIMKTKHVSQMFQLLDSLSLYEVSLLLFQLSHCNLIFCCSSLGSDYGGTATSNSNTTLVDKCEHYFIFFSRFIFEFS